MEASGSGDHPCALLQAIRGKDRSRTLPHPPLHLKTQKEEFRDLDVHWGCQFTTSTHLPQTGLGDTLKGTLLGLASGIILFPGISFLLSSSSFVAMKSASFGGNWGLQFTTSTNLPDSRLDNAPKGTIPGLSKTLRCFLNKYHFSTVTIAPFPYLVLWGSSTS